MELLSAWAAKFGAILVGPLRGLLGWFIALEVREAIGAFQAWWARRKAKKADVTLLKAYHDEKDPDAKEKAFEALQNSLNSGR